MTVRLSNLFESGLQSVLTEWKTQQRSTPSKVPNGSPAKLTRSTAQTKIPAKSDSSSSSSSSVSTSRSTVVANGGIDNFFSSVQTCMLMQFFCLATRRLKISSDSDDESGSTRPTRSSVKAAMSPDASTSTSLPSELIGSIIFNPVY